MENRNLLIIAGVIVVGYVWWKSRKPKTTIKKVTEDESSFSNARGRGMGFWCDCGGGGHMTRCNKAGGCPSCCGGKR